MWKKVVVGLALVYLVVAVWMHLAEGGSATADHGGNDSGASQSDVWAACKDAVKDSLRNPDTADFEITKTTIKHFTAAWKVAGSVKAKNDFGVEQELTYSCSTDDDGIVSTVHVN